MCSFKIFKVVSWWPFLFVSALMIFVKIWQCPYFLFFCAVFGILALSVWWHFVVMLHSKQDIPNDLVNQWFPLLIKFIWLMNVSNVYYSYYQHMPLTCYPKMEYWISKMEFFFFTIYCDPLQLRFIYFCLFFGLQHSLSWSGNLEMFILTMYQW